MQGGRLQPEPDKVAPNRLVHHGWMARQPKNDAIGWWNPTTSGAKAPSVFRGDGAEGAKRLSSRSVVRETSLVCPHQEADGVWPEIARAALLPASDCESLRDRCSAARFRGPHSTHVQVTSVCAQHPSYSPRGHHRGARLDDRERRPPTDSPRKPARPLAQTWDHGGLCGAQMSRMSEGRPSGSTHKPLTRARYRAPCGRNALNTGVCQQPAR